MTCTEYQEYKRKAPGLIARVGSMVKNTWSFTVTTVVEAWNMCYNGVGTTFKNIWNALKWLIDLARNIWKGMLEWVGRIWKGLTDCVGEIWNRFKMLAEWIFATMMWADEYVYHGGLWVAERYWDCAEWLAECAWNGTEWIWDQIEWLSGVSKENASWLTKKAWIGSKQWAEWAWGKRNGRSIGHGKRLKGTVNHLNLRSSTFWRRFHFSSSFTMNTFTVSRKPCDRYPCGLCENPWKYSCMIRDGRIKLQFL